MHEADEVDFQTNPPIHRQRTKEVAMKNLRTMLALARENDIMKIRKWKITTDELVECVGELNELDRRNVEVFEKYRAGDGTVKPFEAAAALQSLVDEAVSRRRNGSGGVRPKEWERYLMLALDFEERTGRSSHNVTPEEQLAALNALDAKNNKINRAA
jgi:hypothetical protein